MRVRSYLCRMHIGETYDRKLDRQFARDLLALLPGELDLEEVQAFRRSELSTEEIRRRRVAGTFNPSTLWSDANLRKMQMSSKPVSNRPFCLRALAFAWDSGIDIGPRFHAARMALHPRAEGGLGKLGPELLDMVWEKSME